MERDPGGLLGEVAGLKAGFPVLLATATDWIPLQSRRYVLEASHAISERERGIPAKIAALDPPREHVPRERDAPGRRPEWMKPRLELRAEGQRLTGHEPDEQECAAEATPRSGDVLSTGTELRPAGWSSHLVDMELACSAVGREVPSTCRKVGQGCAPWASSADPSRRRGRRGSPGREKKERRGRPGGVGLIHGARLLLSRWRASLLLNESRPFRGSAAPRIAILRLSATNKQYESERSGG